MCISENLHSEKILSMGMFHQLFPDHLVLTPQLNEVYELALAYYESRILSEEELIQNGAYFVRIGKKLTNHYLMCTGETLRLPKHSSSRLKSFFEKNQFRTGYATHGLFPYRGKFHPQMIKALINVMGLKPGDTLLDPMMGSGTVPIEASLMGIKTIGLDASPFCRFMTQVKYNALTLPTQPLEDALKKTDAVFEIFSQFSGKGDQDHKSQHMKELQQGNILAELADSDSSGIVDFLLLAYFDSIGYAQRSKQKSPLKLFQSILERYVFVVKKTQQVFQNTEYKISPAQVSEGDARAMDIENQSVDGIIFSPPYSFAIDYLENDLFHLNYLGTDIHQLKEKMVGLRGKSIKEKYELYINDMKIILSECSRVIKPNCFCTIIIGTNNNQLSKAIGVPREQVQGLHRILIDLAANCGLSIVRKLYRQISGIANTMRDEYIVIFQKK